MIKFIIELLTKLKTILNSLELIKYIISKMLIIIPKKLFLQPNWEYFKSKILMTK